MKNTIQKWLVIILGSITWSWTMIKSGWFYSSLGTNGSGLGFWGANGHDGIWHIALSESLGKGSLLMPIFAGAPLQNYHIGFDLILAFFNKITSIPVHNLYFQILPPVFALLIGTLTYKFVFNWTKSDLSAFWATFFVYFGGGFGWVTGHGESAFWSQQAISTLINPPFALSLIFLLLGLLLLMKLEKKFTLIYFVLAVLVFGCLIELKVYAGVLGLGALLVTGIYSYVFQKKTVILKVFIGSLLFSLVLYLPLNKSSVGLLVFQPFWFLETMMGMSDRIGWTKFYSAMLTYKSGHIWIKAVAFYALAFAFFIIGNFGTRIISLLRKIKLNQLNVFIYSILGAGIVIPMFFLQKGTPWNTIQFFYYSLFFSSILAGIVVSQIKNKIILFIVVMLTIPTTIITLRDVYIPSRPPAMLSSDEMFALGFLSKQPKGTVLTKPFDEIASKSAESSPPRPLYLYTSTAYVSAFSKHQTFLEDEINLDITSYNWRERREKVLDWYKEDDFQVKRDFLRENNIKYIYWIKSGVSPLDLEKLFLSNIYENNSITVYQVE
jgi:hypothetical protein